MQDGKVSWRRLRHEDQDRRLRCEALYKAYKGALEDGTLPPALVYDRQCDFFAFEDGLFAFSREYANWGLLRKRGLTQ